MQDFDVRHDFDVMAAVKDDPEQLTSYSVLLVFRRLIMLHFGVENVRMKNYISTCFKVLCDLLILQKNYSHERFEQSKSAIAQAFHLLVLDRGNSMTFGQLNSCSHYTHR